MRPSTPFYETSQLQNLTHKQTQALQWQKEYVHSHHALSAAFHLAYDGYYKLAVFTLHQCVDHTCTAITNVYTGYRLASHNLSRLLAVTKNFTPRLRAVFPCDTKEECHYFQVLCRANSQERFLPCYHVPEEVAWVLIDRVSDLLNIAQQLFEEQIEKSQYEHNNNIPT